MDEANQESHEYGLRNRELGDNPDWTIPHLDRAESLVARDKNWPCVLIWSLGNEGGKGINSIAMAEKVREMDATRLVFSDTDRRQLCMYDTGILPPFEICVYTRDIVNEINENGGYIELDYLIELRGVSMQYSHIRVEAEEQIVSQKSSYVYEREYETP
jgi:beta-galactosidase